MSNMYKNAIFYIKLWENYWNMTLNCTDLSFYTKNTIFLIPLKLKKKIIYNFPPKVLKPKDFRSEVISCINPLIKLPDFK